MKVITDQTYGEFLKEPLSVLYFSAAWCGPCKSYGPIIESVSQQRQEIAFGKVDVDESPELSSKYGVRGIPTTIVFRNGTPVDTRVGAVSKSQLEAWIDSLPSE